MGDPQGGHFLKDSLRKWPSWGVPQRGPQGVPGGVDLMARCSLDLMVFWGPFGGQFGALLGPFWGPIGGPLGALLGAKNAPPRGPSKGSPRGSLGRGFGGLSGCFFGASLALWGAFWRFGELFLGPWGYLIYWLGEHLISKINTLLSGWVIALVVGPQHKWLSHSISGWVTALMVGP